jgi:hypothetical protein
MRDKFPQPVAIKAIGDSLDEVVLPHLDSAYRLARWLMRNDEDAKTSSFSTTARAARIRGSVLSRAGERVGDPIGTVMWRLSRARQALRDALDSEANASLAAEYLKTS